KLNRDATHSTNSARFFSHLAQLLDNLVCLDSAAPLTSASCPRFFLLDCKTQAGLDLLTLVSIHDYLAHHLRHTTLFCRAGSVAGISLVFVWHYQRIRIIPIAISAVLYIIAYYYHFSARCPRCDTRLLFALASFGVRLRLPAWYKTCPSCGLSFD